MEKGKISQFVRKVRESNPLIHNITNVVVANFSANGLLALGASPVMANAVEEAADMAKVADAVVLNTGTLNRETIEAMLIAGKSANEVNTPVILDPVGVGATTFRTEAVQKLLNEVKVGAIRGNAAEVANLIGEKWEIKGVDARNISGNVVELAERAAKQLQTLMIVTGREDIISDGSQTYIVQNGHPILTKVTGTGCLLSAVVGAFIAVEQDALEAAVAALTFYGVAAEVAVNKMDEKGPGSFQVEFLDQLSLISSAEIDLYGSFKQIKGEE